MKSQKNLTVALVGIVVLSLSGCFFQEDLDADNTPEKETCCDDGMDNDQDGLFDCADPDCRQATACKSPSQEICDNGIDDDGDGMVDCADNSCAEAEACAEDPEDPKEICTNQKDDDGDGMVDCMDPDCRHLPHCAPPVEICDNQTDDDNDGDTDCEDDDCSQHAACRPQDSCCQAHDTPGCADPEVEACVCAQNSYCCEMQWDDVCVAQVEQFGCGQCLPQTEIDCGNGIDDDGDGLKDCMDPDCSGVASCSCDQAHPSPGCGDTAVEACVCSQNCYCCEMAWDSVCVAQAQQLGCYE